MKVKESRGSYIDFKPKTVTRDKQGHYIMTEGLIYQEDIMLVNIYATNIGALIHIKEITNLNGDIDSNAILTGHFNIPLLTKDRSSRQKINEEMLDVMYMLDQINLTDIYRTFQPAAAEYTLFQVNMEHSLR